MGHDVVTSAELVQALRANGGVKHSISEMIGINRRQVEAFESKNAGVIRLLQDCGEHLETKFEQDVAIVYEYSNYGPGVRYNLVLASDDAASSYERNVEENDKCSEFDENEANEIIDEVDDFVVDDDFEEDIAVDELGQGLVTRCIVYSATEIDTRKNRMAKASISALSYESDKEDPLTCSICRRKFSTTSNLSQHKCKGVVGKKDMLSFAILYACNVFDQHDFEVINAATDAASLQVLTPVFGIPLDNFLFESGWGKTRTHGSKYGRKYIEPFKNEIVD